MAHGFDSFLPPSLRGPATSSPWQPLGKSGGGEEHDWWEWESRPEFGPHSESGGVSVTQWAVGKTVLSVKVGLERDPLTVLDLLRETDATSNYPLFIVDPITFQPAPLNEPDAFQTWLDVLSYQRLMYFVVQF